MNALRLRLTAPDLPAREFALSSGISTFGRFEGNTHVIEHGSISGSHCEVTVAGGSVRVRDLGSTNGAYIDGERIKEAALLPGQTLRLGSVELTLVAAEAAPALPPTVPPPSRLQVAAGPTRPRVAVETSLPDPRRKLAPLPIEPPAPRAFATEVPLAFTYPFRGNGIILLISGAVLFTLLDYLASLACLGTVIGIAATGYLFAYMQRIIASSALGDREMPQWPDLSEFWSDLLRPALLYLWTLMVCFGPALLVAYTLSQPLVAVVQAAAAAFQPGGPAFLLTAGQLWPVFAVLGVAAFGAFCFPMTLLAVAMTDNFLAVNPLVIVPSIFRVLGPYLIAFFVLAGLLHVAVLGGVAGKFIPIPILPALIVRFLSLCLLAVEMRILGLLYLTNRERLGWFAKT